MCSTRSIGSLFSRKGKRGEALAARLKDPMKLCDDPTDVTAAPPASVADLFDRLDAALAGQGAGITPDLAQAIAALALTLHGPNQSPQPGQEAGFLSSLRLDFAELVARALWVQTEAA